MMLMVTLEAAWTSIEENMEIVAMWESIELLSEKKRI